MQSLAARLARGEESAFAELYDACADRLHNYLAGRLGSRDRADDVLQSDIRSGCSEPEAIRGRRKPVGLFVSSYRQQRTAPTAMIRKPSLPHWLDCPTTTGS